ncbi:thiosulfate:glutathione sulfurtransferase isoform X1 [Microcaecilia unicolor]|uniref:Thiosulfate:glutathione sulfurtransferase isoform X1 n=1 Tax=Microcaecilia unicolor TaxID=1415580 RepID=A0A6P7WYI6_9AMPH|nr:thiosulfate:glutathione sulfurtransferase isoform X1 [Microcaecilia unicolor]
MICLRTLFLLRPLALPFYAGGSRQAACTMTAGTISYEDLKKLTASGKGRIFDVRSPEEVAQGKIPNSINIPVDKVEAALKMDPETFQKTYLVQKPKPEDENIIFHCQIGKRGARAAETAVTLGYTKVCNYAGGYKEWSEKEGK